MAKQSKVEQYGCQEIVANGLRSGKSVRDIAEDCTEWAGTEISHSAVQRYIEKLDKQKLEVVVSDERAVVNVVHQDFNIIQTTLKLANTLLARFDFIDNIPDYFEERMQELEHAIVEDTGADPMYLQSWSQAMNYELKRKVNELTSLSKETRELMKFMADLKERVFRFELMSEYLHLFMMIFQKYNPDAFDKAMQEVGSNPRMAQIVEQQRAYASGKE